MDIDYTAIITKANARKDRLLNLAAQLEQTPEMVKMLQEVRAWAIQVTDMYGMLDREGRDLLPKKVLVALEYGSNTVVHLEYAIVDGSAGISKWGANV